MAIEYYNQYSDFCDTVIFNSNIILKQKKKLAEDKHSKGKTSPLDSFKTHINKLLSENVISKESLNKQQTYHFCLELYSFIILT